MAAKENLITTTEITVNPREIDFVTRFQRNWDHLREIMGIMRPIRMQPGTVLKSKYAQGTLQSGTVAEGEEIPNIVMYYVDPSDSDYAKAGLVYTTAGEASNLIGFHTQGNYTTAVSESFAITGVTLFAEYLDGISVQTITPGESV